MDQQKLVLDTALAYLAAGIVPVVVTHPSDTGHRDPGKEPRMKGWQRVAPSPAIVRSWFSKPSNLGVLCGRRSGFVCVDVDPRNGGMAWLIENDHRFGYHLRENTGSGGFHLYYRYPQGVDHVPSLTGKSGLAPGVELKADGGHQVVTWPSQHPSGGEYEFAHGLSLLDLEAEADELPAWILEIAQEHHQKQVTFTVPEGYKDDPTELERAVQLLERHGPAVQGSGGDMHTYRAACLGLNFGISPQVWWPYLAEWNKTCQPPWNRDTLAKKLKGAYRYEAEDFGKFTAAADFPDEIEEPATLEAAEAEAQAEELGVSRYKYSNPNISARKFLRTLQGYLHSEGIHYVYSDNTWNAVSDGILKSRVRQEVLRYDPDSSIKTKHVSEIVNSLQDCNHRDRLTFEIWDDGRTGDYIRLNNGILDLNRIKLLPHTPTWFSCTKLPFDYDPDARCPTFESFLQSIWDKKPDNILALQLWFGYVLSRQTNQQKFAMFLGKSRSGKGTILRLLESLVGKENSLPLKLSSFKNDFYLERAPGKKIITVGDAHAGPADAAALAAEFILNVAGEDSIPINRKNKSIIAVRLPAKINVAANRMPKFFDAENAISNRMLLFYFTKTFRGREDIKLEEKLTAELPGILNWAIDGYQKFVERGRLLQSEEGQSRLDEFVEYANPTDTFFRDFISYDPDDEKPPVLFVDEAYELYKVWCQREKHMALAKSKFSSEISNFFADNENVIREQSKGRRGAPRKTYYTNLRLTCTTLELQNESAVADFDGDLNADDDFI